MLDFLFNIQNHLQDLVANHGLLVYLILAGILFGETGVIVLPFLPGDTLLFTCGVLAAQPNTAGTGPILHLWMLLTILPLAAILGDSTNYWIARGLRRMMMKNGKIPLVSAELVQKAHTFFERYGGWGVALGRWVPLVRTVVPFTAGLTQMTYSKFLLFSVIGNFVWVAFFTLLGFYLGKFQIVKDNFEAVTLILIALVLVAVAMHFVKQMFKSKKSGPAVSEGYIPPDRS